MPANRSPADSPKEPLPAKRSPSRTQWRAFEAPSNRTDADYSRTERHFEGGLLGEIQYPNLGSTSAREKESASEIPRRSPPELQPMERRKRLEGELRNDVSQKRESSHQRWSHPRDPGNPPRTSNGGELARGSNSSRDELPAARSRLRATNQRKPRTQPLWNVSAGRLLIQFLEFKKLPRKKKPRYLPQPQFLEIWQ